MGLFKRKQVIPFESYFLHTPVHKNTPEHAVRWAVLDLEATGFDVHSDRILSVAVAIVENGQFHMDSCQSWLVYQSQNCVNEATKIHGILPSQTEGGIPEEQMLETLIPLLQGTILVGHHVGFDIAMLDVALKKHFSIALKNQVLDTALFASKELDAFQRTGYSNQPLPTMEDVCFQLNIPMAERHTAEGDVFTNVQMFLILRGRLKMRLQRELTLSDYPLIEAKRVLRFGKHVWKVGGLGEKIEQFLQVLSLPSHR